MTLRKLDFPSSVKSGVSVNEAGAEKDIEPPIKARARLRPKAQLTLPDPIRKALCISEGDEVEFTVHEDGRITVRGYVSVPSDQAWQFKPVDSRP
jgi:AbrB family looped-hinge helix DNA binding protein